MWLREDAALPSSVLGPVDSCEFARLAAICACDDIFEKCSFVRDFGSGDAAGRTRVSVT